MTAEDYVTRREFEVLQIEVRAMRSDSTAIAVMSSQIERLNKDLGDVKSSVIDGFKAHEKVHQKDSDDRVTGRRWMIMAAITLLAALAGLYGWMALLLHK